MVDRRQGSLADPTRAHSEVVPASSLCAAAELEGTSGKTAGGMSPRRSWRNEKGKPANRMSMIFPDTAPEDDSVLHASMRGEDLR